MALDLAHAHAPRIHRDDLLIEAGKAALIFGDQLRVECALAIPRDVQGQPARVGQHGLLAIAVAGVCMPVGGLAAKMLVHLRV